MSRHVAPRHISVSCRVMSRHFTSRRIMSHYVALCLNISAISHAVEFILVVLRSGSHVMSRHAMSHQCVMLGYVTSFHVTSHHVTLCRIMSQYLSHLTCSRVRSCCVEIRITRHVTSCRVTSHYVTSFHNISRHVMSCPVLSCRVTLCYVMSRHVM